MGVVTLDIIDTPDGQSSGSIVTNKTTTHVVGQQVTLFASPQPAATLSNISWSVSGNTVKSYTNTQTSGVKTPLASTDLQSQQAQFYWYEGSGTGTNSVNLSADFPTNFTGYPKPSVSTSFVVQAPSFGSIGATTQKVQVGLWQPAPSSPALSLGTILNPPTSAGITFTFQATAPLATDGYMAATQLISSNPTQIPNPKSSSTPSPVTDTGKNVFWLDGCVLIAQNLSANGYITDFSAKAGQSITYQTIDAPVSFLGPDDNSYTDSDSFEDYFIYRPTGKHSIWITIGKLPTWGWGGTAERIGDPNTWALDVDTVTQPKSTLTGAAFAQLPTWSKTLHPLSSCPAVPSG